MISLLAKAFLQRLLSESSFILKLLDHVSNYYAIKLHLLWTPTITNIIELDKRLKTQNVWVQKPHQV